MAAVEGTIRAWGGRFIGCRRPNPWSLGAFLVAALIAAPLAAVVFLALSPSGGIWGHLLATVLPRYVRTTLGLMLGAGLGTLVIGAGTAWLVTLCRFPGRKIFEWALLLPLAIPTYVVAYVYTDLLEFAGPVQGWLREAFSWTTGRDYWFPEIRSLGGAISMMTLVLYPYVYLLARVAFSEQSACVLEAGRTLGRGPWLGFFTIALPLARPAIVIGVSLVLMEALNDFGTVDFFAVETMTTGIYDVWLNMNNISGAAQMAAVTLAFGAVLISAERWARRGQRYYQTNSKSHDLPSYRLAGGRALLAFLGCLLPIALGFLLPASVLFRFALRFYEDTLSGDFFVFVRNSLTLSLTSAFFAVAVGLYLAYGVRQSGTRSLKAASRISSIGYSVPGAVLAVGVMIPLAQIDAVTESIFGASTGLVLSGTIFAVTYGYLVRFLALSYGTSEASLAKVTPSMDGAARTLGLEPFQTLRRVHFPLIRRSVLAAGILVFVDCMKELPMTIILRPFNYETLATSVHQFASDELLEEAALGALTIVVAGILPVILLSVAIRKSRLGPGVHGRAWG